MKNIAIIGSKSFLAGHIKKIFDSQEYMLKLYGRRGLDNEENVVLFNYPSVPIDLQELLSFDAIIYCAAGGVQSSIEDDCATIYYLNAYLPIEITCFLHENGFRGKLITFGSYFEIGSNSDYRFFKEKEIVFSHLEVHNNYCVSKRLMSRFVFDSIARISHYHLILPTIYGSTENANRLIPYIVSGLKNGNDIKLTSGQQLRQFIHGSDVANLVKIIVDNEIRPSIYNVADQNSNTIREIVEILFDFFDKDAASALGKINKRDESMNVLLIDGALTKEITNWQPKVSLRNGLSEYINN